VLTPQGREFIYILGEESLLAYESLELGFVDAGTIDTGSVTSDKTMDAGVTPDGTVYVAYSMNNQLKLAHKGPAPGSSWIFSSIPDAAADDSIALSIRRDGKVGVASWNKEGGVVMTSEVSPNQHEVIQREVGETMGDEVHVDCVYGRDGRLLPVWSDNGELRLLNTQFTTVADRSKIRLREEQDGTLVVHYLAYYFQTLITVRLDRQTWETSERIRNLDLTSLLVDGPTRMDLAVDPNGFPCVALSVQTQEGSRVFFASPADAHDQDGDGIPLVTENAHCLDPSAESGGMLPVTKVGAFSGEISVTTDYRRPSYHRSYFERMVGEFQYNSMLSADLNAWYEVDVYEQLIGDDVISEFEYTPTPFEPGVSRGLRKLFVNADGVSAIPRTFVRFGAKRILQMPSQ